MTSKIIEVKVDKRNNRKDEFQYIQIVCKLTGEFCNFSEHDCRKCLRGSIEFDKKKTKRIMVME